LVLLSQRQYPNVWGFFSVGANDTEFVKEMTEVSTAAQKAGMTIKIVPVPNQGHSWAVPAAILLPGLEWLGPRLGLTRPATS
jgi:hypothetical protein